MKILVIEDDSELVELISIALEIGWPEAKLISTHLGKSGVELVSEENPDIVLLDLGLPDKCGFEVLRAIRSFSDVPIIIETVNKNEDDVVKGLGLGANEYIYKPFGKLELLARIKTVLKNHPSKTSNEYLTCGKLYLDVVQNQLTQGSRSIKLTPTETRIMQALLRNAGQTQTFNDLAEIVWGTDYPGSVNPLRIYIHRIRKKIRFVSDSEVNSIITLPGVGFMLMP